MKRCLVVILTLLLLLMLTACGKKATLQGGTTQTTPSEAGSSSQEQTNTGAEAPAPEPQKKTTFQLTSYKVEDDRYSDDGTVLLASSEYDVPKLTAIHADGVEFDPNTEGAAPEMTVANSVNQYFTDWLSKEQEWFEEVAQMAREDYAANSTAAYSLWQDDSYYYADTMGFTSWQNDNLLCVMMQNHNFTGGVHGYSGQSAVTFDLSTGKVLKPADLTSDYSGLTDAVTQEIIRQIQDGELAAQYGMSTYFNDYKDTVSDWMERAVSFNDDGMTVVFAVYDIAPYAYGEQVFNIPYDMLTPYLSDTGRQLLGL
ncbi:MAG: DUF3298 domain-containing protein [Clostridiales bacterium]|nr:DUF3298 domain-containing protein [Clostridiales bacterium]